LADTPNNGNGSLGSAENYFAGLSGVLAKLDLAVVDRISSVLFEAYKAGKTAFLLGNGGSAALASHFACDLGKGTLVDGTPRFRALALTDSVPMLTAWANDSNYADVFSQQLKNFVQSGDIVFAISGSGNSPNVLKALETGREYGAYNVGITGFQGGKMKPLCDLCLVVPSDNMQYIEDVHLVITHAVFAAVREKILTARGANAVAAAY
jgi:D-sedoheptulose 7-phosphate isomerase